MHAVYDDENGRLLFATTHFSHYAVVETEGASGTVIASGTCGAEGDGDNLTWTLYDDGTFVISGTGAMADYPDSNEPWWNIRHSITTVVIEEGVTSIGNAAFYDCKNLASVTMPTSLTRIGKNAFYQCMGLTEINIPDSVTSIGVPAFSSCTSLTDINVGAENTCYCSEDGVLFNKDKTTIICYPGGKHEETYAIPSTVTSIRDYAFASCYDIVEVTVLDGVTSIGDYAFANCWELAEMTLPDGVTSIGDYAFADCWELASVNIPDGVTSIGEATFDGCESLTEITIPDSVTSIGLCAFSGCESLESIIIPDSVTFIDREAFAFCCSLESVTIPDGVTSIKDGTFYCCESLSEVLIPSSVTSIEENAFSGCSSLSEVEIPDGVTRIGSRAFKDCTGLTEVTIPNGVTNIESGTFSGCESLAEVTIPASVTTIGDSAFDKCTGLSDVYFGGTEAQWADITIGTDNKCLTEANIHFTEPSGYKVTLIDNTNKTNDVAVIDGIIDGKEYSGEVPFTVTCNRICVAVYTVGNEQIKLTPEIANGVYSFTLPVYDSVTLEITYLGDVNRDGFVKANDSQILAKYLADWAGYDKKVYMPAADIDGNGSVKTNDLQRLAKYLADWQGYAQYFLTN